MARSRVSARKMGPTPHHIIRHRRPFAKVSDIAQSICRRRRAVRWSMAILDELRDSQPCRSVGWPEVPRIGGVRNRTTIHVTEIARASPGLPRMRERIGMEGRQA